MAIKVTIEPDEGPAVEHCFKCFKKTKYWYTRKDVACCQSCAAVVRVADVPSKEEWCKEVGVMLKASSYPTYGERADFYRFRKDWSTQLTDLRGHVERTTINGVPFIPEETVHKLMIKAIEIGYKQGKKDS